MEHKFTNLEDCKVEILSTVPADIWKDAQAKALKKACEQVTIPGFRKGHAPEAMAKSHVNGQKVIDEAINEVLPTVFADAVKEGKIEPFFRPDVEVTKLSDTDLEIKFTVTLAPKVTLGEYTGLHVEKNVPSVDEKEVADAISARLERNAELVVTDAEAKNGDTVVIDFEGFIDGKAFDGGKADNYSLVLGSHSFVPGFEEGLVGIKSGESKDIEVTFPEQYVKELAGKKATFKVTVHEVKEKKIPTLSDEAVADLGVKDVKTVDELKEFEKKDLLERKTRQEETRYYNELVKLIVDAAKVECNSTIIDNEAAASEDQLKKQVESNGLTFEQYLEITGQKLEDLKKKIHDESEANVKGYLVLQTIAAKEKLLVDDAELDHELAKTAEKYGMKVEDLRKAYGDNLNGFRSNLVNAKIHDFLLAHNA